YSALPAAFSAKVGAASGNSGSAAYSGSNSSSKSECAAAASARNSRNFPALPEARYSLLDVLVEVIAALYPCSWCRGGRTILPSSPASEELFGQNLALLFGQAADARGAQRQ